jgi:membrane-bound lytic murein transglycosylase F
MGFNYELLKEFTDHLGIDLEIITENHLEHAFNLLNSGDADVIAMGLTVNSSRRKYMEFTDPILETRQVLVQHKPRNWRSMTPEAMNKHLVRDQLDLAGKTIYVQENSAHLESLRSLESEIGDSINIIPVPYESEELIQNVVRGDIDYTVCDENVAMVNSTYYPEIDIATPVSFRQNIAWGIRKTGSEQLLAGLNSWINSFTRTRSYALLYAKYFKNTRSVKIVNSDYYSLSTGKISVWDDLIRNASRDINWDWLLLASLIYQESRFDPDVESEAGAVGLMQVMPQTGEKFGIDIQVSPANNIKAGTLYIRQLQKIFETKVSDPQERLKFVLASYNAGPGHVLDAMRLAEKNGLNHQIWDDNVAAYLLKKSQPQYFNDAVVKNGYFRGTESVNFVNEILDRYDHYRNIITVGNNSLSMITRQD